VLRALLFMSVWTLTAQARPPLVRVYCTELLFRQEQNLPIAQTDTAWKDFTERLESGAVRAADNLKVDPARVQRCMNENHDEMDEGEFLLEGKRMLRDLASARRNSKNEHAFEPMLGSVNLPGFGEVQMGSVTRRAESSSVERVTQRSTHYDSLWSSYLERLRKTMTARRDPLKMK
jgi:hypothetical protein